MENQINVGDQNTQQIGQNLASQPAQIPEKPKKNYWMISTILLLVILVGGMVWFGINLKSKSKLSSNQQITTPGLTNQATTQPSQQIIKSLPVALFMQINLPDYPKHKNGSIILSSFDTQSGLKNEILNLDACYNLPSTLSPDKTKMAYISMSNSECEKQYYTNVGNAELWVYNFQSKTKQLAASGVWNNVAPQWSLDGKYLGYERVTDSQSSREQKVYFYDLGTKEERLITTLTGVSSGLVAISSDKNFIYFKTIFDLLKINIQNGSQTKLFTVDNGYDASFYIAPDRTKMAVFSMEGWYGGKKTPTNWKIGVIDLTNDSYKELYAGTDSISLLISDSDNKPLVTNDLQVIYGATGQSAGLWSINLLTGTKTKIHTESPNPQGVSTADLSLNGKYLLYGTWFTENTSPTESWSHWHFYVINLSDNSVQELKDFDYHTEKAIYLMN